MKSSLLVLLLLLLWMTGACAPGETLARASGPAPRAPRSTRAVELHGAASLVAWEAAGRRALRSGLAIAPSFRELVRFPVHEPHAVAYRFTLRRGQSLHVRVEPVGGSEPVIAEIFELVTADMFRPARTAHGNASSLTFTAGADAQYVLRLQPPAGSGGLYDVTVRGDRALVFPVSGAGTAAIGSWFGDPRDGGARSHEGVDIFAPRGTPVLAVTDGYVLSARPTPVGGNNVWIEDHAGGFTYYYAHLDEQRVWEGQRVAAGDTIGTVGNTGNARGLNPHLHFSIYLPGRVAVDPAPLLDSPGWIDEPVPDTSVLGRRARVTGHGVRLRATPSLAGAILAELQAGSSLLVLGGVNDWHRVVLGDGTTGFVAARYTDLSLTEGR